MTVEKIREKGHCCGCGICEAVCPVGAVSLQVLEGGELGPVISEACVQCGKCLKTCGGALSQLGKEKKENGEEVRCLAVTSKDEGVLRNSTSGGFITALVKALLEKELYQGAFLVGQNIYGEKVQTRLYKKNDDLKATAKSRYVQVAHGDEVSYMLANRNEKLVLVGTPCYFRGLQEVLKANNLERENYLFVGLFCDMTMTTHVWDYFNTVFAEGKLSGMDFRNKECGGWPGDMRLYPAGGEAFSLSRRERMDIKEYFMPPCCLDCMDKLNPYGDFSVGDNYATGQKGSGGSSCVMVRTERAATLMAQLEELFVIEELSMESIMKSQKMDGREAKQAAQRSAREKKLALGAAKDYEGIKKAVDAKRANQKNPLKRILRKCKSILKG